MLHLAPNAKLLLFFSFRVLAVNEVGVYPFSLPCEANEQHHSLAFFHPFTVQSLPQWPDGSIDKLTTPAKTSYNRIFLSTFAAKATAAKFAKRIKVTL
ncbi:MAG: hypothetical protein ACLS29_10030 [Prevotellamassilia sp.]